MGERSVLVVGAGGAIGLEAVKALQARNIDVIASWRRPHPQAMKALAELGVETEQLDLKDDEKARRLIERAGAVVFVPVLTASAAMARHLRPDQPAVFFSSNNVDIGSEARIYQRLIKAEKEVRRAAPHAVILRPTMIYGHAGDRNLSRLIKFMKRSPLTPIPGAGEALQQPVYYADLAKAAVSVLFDARRQGETVAVAGPAPVTLKELYKAVREAAGARTAFVPVPVKPLADILRALESRGVHPPIKSVQLLRAGRDKTPRGDNIIATETGPSEGLRKLVKVMAK